MEWQSYQGTELTFKTCVDSWRIATDSKSSPMVTHSSLFNIYFIDLFFNFEVIIGLHNFPFLFFSSIPTMHSPMPSFKFLVSFIHYCSLHICIFTDKTRWVILCYFYVCLLLDNQLVCSSMGEDYLPTSQHFLVSCNFV